MDGNHWEEFPKSLSRLVQNNLVRIRLEEKFWESFQKSTKIRLNDKFSHYNCSTKKTNKNGKRISIRDPSAEKRKTHVPGRKFFPNIAYF